VIESNEQDAAQQPEPQAEPAAPEAQPEAPEAQAEPAQAEAPAEPTAPEAPPSPEAESPPAEEPAESNGAGDAEAPAAAAEEVPEERPRTLAELAADARYSATGKRKSSVARVIIRPGSGQFSLNGRPLEDYFPRRTHQAVVRQPLEASGFGDRIDVRARIHGGGISGQADAVRHGIAKALIEADPALRGELKRRQFLTRDPRVKERKKAGLKKARKRPQFSKR
jgi:small subunit ribosomal protein S9